MGGLPLRPRVVGGQFEDSRCAGEMACPVSELLRAEISRQPGSLPTSVVGVPNGERRQWGGLARAIGVVECAQLAEEDAHRPGVSDDVVQHDQEDVVVRGQTKQGGAQERLPGYGARARHGARRWRSQPLLAVVPPVCRLASHHVALSGLRWFGQTWDTSQLTLGAQF
jgi:hypothetical protein